MAPFELFQDRPLLFDVSNDNKKPLEYKQRRFFANGRQWGNGSCKAGKKINTQYLLLPLPSTPFSIDNSGKFTKIVMPMTDLCPIKKPMSLLPLPSPYT